MKRYLFPIILFVLVSTQVSAQVPVYPMSNQTVSGICTGAFTDSNVGVSLWAGTYGNNESFTMTFCSGSAQPITFIFSSLNITAGDHLMIYDGPNTSSTLLYDLTNTNPGALTITSSGSCFTFVFTSDGSGGLFESNGDWSAGFTCGTVDPADIASDACADAPSICDLEGYFGNTSASYTPDEPGNMCQSCGLFGGSLENNSWLKFIPNNDTVIFTITLLTCSDGVGIQFGVYSGTNCNNFVLMTDPNWTSSSSPISPGTVSTIIATGLTPGQVYYIMIDGNGGDDCQYVINAQSGIALGAGVSDDQTICPGESATITLSTASSIPVTWSSNPADPSLVGQEHNTNITVSPTTTTTYSVYVSDTAGFCAVDTTLYTMVTVLPFNDPSCLTGLNCNITKTDATTCPVPPANTCNGTAVVNVAGGTGSYTYLWNDGNTSSSRSNLCEGTFTVTVTDNGSSIPSTNCSITILGPDDPTFSFTTIGSCTPGSNGSIDVTPLTGVPPYTYAWSNSATTEDLNGISSGNYSVTITDSVFCKSDTVINVGSVPGPQVNFNVTGNGCSPVTATFQDNTPGSITSWHWVLGDGTTVDDSTLFSHVYYATDETETYAVTLTVTDADGCTGELTLPDAVTVYPIPVASITANPMVAYLNEPITFTGGEGYGINTWSWNFDYPTMDFVGSSTNTTTYAYSTQGTYTVYLLVSNNGGCSDTASLQVDIIEIVIPNIMTPNGDGYNDFFEITNIERLQNTNVTIYNRWGKKVLDANNYQNDWAGEKYADGTYYYVITLGGETYFHGTVTLLR